MRPFLSVQKYPALLTFLSIAILLVGILVKPKKASTEGVVSETETMRLEQIAQKDSLESMTAFLSAIAGDTGAQVVYVPHTGASGIVWNSGGEIVTTRNEQAADLPASVKLPGGREVAASLRPSDPPIQALQITDAPALRSLSPVLRAPAPSSSWVIQVARRQNGSLFFTPGLQRGIRPVTCGEKNYREIDTTIDLTPAMAGGGLFDLDGQLLGVLVPCGVRMIALPAADVDQALVPKVDPVAEAERHWGMKLDSLDDAAQKYFRTKEGLLVREVRQQGLAARNGLLPGDVLLAFNGEALGSIADFVKIASPDSVAGAKLTVFRQARQRIVSLAGQEPSAIGPSDRVGDIGLQIEPPPAGYVVGSVAPDSAAGRAGVMPGDRLLEVNGAKVERFDDLGKLLNKSRDEPDYLVVSRGERQIGILLP